MKLSQLINDYLVAQDVGIDTGTGYVPVSSTVLMLKNPNDSKYYIVDSFQRYIEDDVNLWCSHWNNTMNDPEIVTFDLDVEVDIRVYIEIDVEPSPTQTEELSYGSIKRLKI